ncbi:MAG: acyl-CoA dehydrogenase, partial [Rubrivivax sp.]
MNAPLSWAELARTLAVEFALRLHQAGLLALAAPRALGGQGATAAQLAQVVGAVARGCPSTALVLTMQYLQHRAMGRPASPWPEALARKLVREAVLGASLVNSLRVEPELGSPARGGLPGTVARRTANGWSITGHKVYCTGSPILSWFLVWARTDEATPRAGFFLVPAHAGGIRIDPTWDHLGLRASGSHDVLLQGVAIPQDHALELRPASEGAPASPAAQADMALLLGALYP